MKERMSKWKGILVAGGVVALLGAGALNGNGILKSTVQATEKDSNGFYKNDVTPPWGRIVIQESMKISGINYVTQQEVTVEIEVSDDMCEDSEIKYYLSLTEISDTSKISSEDWKPYSPGVTESITLPSTTEENKLYVAFRDYNGNTTIIYSGTDLEQTITYNANATDATMPTGMANKRMHGAPFVITMQTPEREDYFFFGWALTPNATTPNFYAGDVIPADMAIGSGNSVTLYAVWTQEVKELVPLASVVEIGDYVNYPVYYANVESDCSLIGWRVISKDVDLDGNKSEGTVNLVSAGAPLNFYCEKGSYYGEYYDPYKTEEKLKNDFLGIEIHATNWSCYRKTGFNANKSLTEIFTNKFTQEGKVRAMTREDIQRSAGITSWSSGHSMNLRNPKYVQLYEIGVTYWLASVNDDGILWCVGYDGYVYDRTGGEIGVRPVVSLKSTVKASGIDTSRAWNIEI